MPAHDADAIARLFSEFLEPPRDALPRVWWHWMDGNVDIDGLHSDLDWMQHVGIGGVQIFDGGMGLPPVVPQPVRPGTPEWNEAIAAALTRGRELGLEVAVATSSGWSASGGPWVRPEDAMKKVVWSTTSIDSDGNSRTLPIAPLPTTVGGYQDIGDADPERGFAVDWRVVAFPSDPTHTPLDPAAASSSAGVALAKDVLIDGSFAESVALPRDPDGPSSAWIEQRFAADVDVRSVVVGLPGPRGFGAAPPARATLEAQHGDGSWFAVAELLDSRAPIRSASFPAVRASAFRLVVSGAAAADALPPMEDGVAVPPVLRPAHAFEISEFALFAGARVHAFEAKAGFGIVRDYDAIDSPEAVVGPIDPRSVLDLTGQLSGDALNVALPPGRWTILRVGGSLTGATNGPAMDDATGLEVDKLDSQRVAAYLERHLARFVGAAQRDLSALVSDSIEAGLQNWTDDIAHQFRARRGYDLAPWLPCLAGWVVGDATSADRFLSDYRRTIADLLAAHYYGTLARVAHEHGLTLYAEALEDGRPQLGDDLAMRAHADVPMGAMWTFSPDRGARPTYVADLRGAASVAHVYGASRTGSEAFTSFEDPWAATPGSLKHVADLQFALGVNRLCIHSSPHQPSTVPAPGMALAPFLGQTFSRHETWSSMARPWVQYLARCSAVLAAGSPAVDIAVLAAEDAPITGLFGESRDLSVPPGFGFDYVGADALADVLDVRDGRLTARGASYRLLYLGAGCGRLSASTLRHIARLVEAGATVVGLPPESSPSLTDDPDAWSAVRESIWGPRHRDRVIATSDLAAALDRLDIRAPLRIADPEVLAISRHVGGSLVTFVANPTAESVETTVSWDAAAGRVARWDPVTTTTSALSVSPPGSVTSSGAAASPSFTLSLHPFESAFLLTDVAAPSPARVAESRQLGSDWSVSVPGHDPRPTGAEPRFWTGDARTLGFSGIGTYSTRFLVDDHDDGRRVFLSFEEVRDIAEVLVNGASAGVVWTRPYRIEVTQLVVLGWNSLEVRVANPWRNRLVAEAAEPTGRMYEPMTRVFTSTAEPRAAGLHGAVMLVIEASEADQPD